VIPIVDHEYSNEFSLLQGAGCRVIMILRKMKGFEDDLRHEIEERLRFETLLTDISAHFINLPVDQVDSEIEDAQRRVCQCLDLDLSSLWQWSGEIPAILTLTHLYSPPTGPTRPGRIDGHEAFPWIFQKMVCKETLAFSTEQLPPEAKRDQETFQYYGIKSSLTLPLFTGGGPLIGILSFNTLADECIWPVEIVNRLNLVAQIFSNALARKHSEEKLRDREARLLLAADSARAILWDLDIDSGNLWTTTQGKEFFGFPMDRPMSFDSFLLVVHPDDREMLEQTVAATMLSGKDANVEYRVVLPDGSLRWVLSRGRPHPESAVRLMGVSIDITERKLIEERILGSEARLAAAIDAAALGFYEMGEDYRISLLDRRIMSDIIGIDSSDERCDEPRVREFWLSHIHSEDLPRIADLSRQVLAEGVDRFTSEYRFLHPKKGVIWLRQVSHVQERNAAGRATRIVGVMQDITERKEEEVKLRENEAALKNNQRDLQRLAGKLISAQEEELRRLSRELHDDLTQRLAVLAIEAGKLEIRTENEVCAVPGESLQRISRIKEQLISISEDVHRISRQLHPTILHDLGLVQAIESECEALQRRENIEIVFRHEDIGDRIRDDIALCLYRIIQEGLRNIIRHSGATRCEIFLKTVDDRICLVIRDEGRGFDPAEVRSKPGLGLSSMRERAQLVQGDFSIDTQVGHGTVIRVGIRLPREGA